MKTRAILTLVAVLIAFGAGGTAAYAQSEGSGSSDWNYSIAPYFVWAMGLDGEITVKGSPGDVDLSFGDILDDLDFMFDFHYEAHHTNGWGYILEPSFFQLDSNGTGPLGGDINVGTDIVLVEALVANTFGTEERPFQLIWGTRYFSMETDFNFSAAPSVGGKKDWLDAVVGMRYLPKLSDRWALSLRGDVGAGGSDFTWQVAALAMVKMSRRTQFAFGYRHLDFDYEDGSGSDLFRFDVAMSGPLLGVNINF